jgi:hypothetical protein
MGGEGGSLKFGDLRELLRARASTEIIKVDISSKYNIWRLWLSNRISSRANSFWDIFDLKMYDSRVLPW